MKILVVDDERDIKILFEQRFRREIKNGEFILILLFQAKRRWNT
jgi:two-component system, chemotaxis family, chemotaxis protein CheY